MCPCQQPPAGPHNGVTKPAMRPGGRALMAACVHCGQWGDTSPIHLHGATGARESPLTLAALWGVFVLVSGALVRVYRLCVMWLTSVYVPDCGCFWLRLRRSTSQSDGATGSQDPHPDGTARGTQQYGTRSRVRLPERGCAPRSVRVTAGSLRDTALDRRETYGDRHRMSCRKIPAVPASTDTHRLSLVCGSTGTTVLCPVRDDVSRNLRHVGHRGDGVNPAAKRAGRDRERNGTRD